MPVDITYDDFWGKVDRRGPTECWEWQGPRVKGYGVLGSKRATHIALASDGRPRRNSLSALHSCDNPPCCNPAHLRWGTDADNVADMIERSRDAGFARSNRDKAKCDYGHDLTDENVRVDVKGWRHCKLCRRARDIARLRRRGIEPRQTLTVHKPTVLRYRQPLEWKGCANGGRRQLTKTEVLTIRSVYQKGSRPSTHDLAHIFGLSSSSVWKILSGQTYQELLE